MVANDLDGRLGAVGRAVRDRVDLAVQLGALLLVLEVVAQQREERHDPEIARLGCGGGFGPQLRELALKDAPVVLGIGPAAGDLILDLRARAEAEVGGALTRQFFEAVDQIGREDRALDAHARIVHWATSGSSMAMPRRSIGSTG